MSILEAALRRVDEAGLIKDSLSIVWHAGEPLVVPREWYSDAFAVVANTLRPDVTAHHNFQTNATLVDDAWCRFILQHRVRVGVSVDGPAELNDLSRHTRRGGGTYDRIMAGVRCLQAAEVPLHAICVLTRAHLDRPDAVFDFFVDHGIREVGFNVEEIDGANVSSSLAVTDAAAAFARFFSRIVERYRQDPDVLAIREIDRVLAHLEFEDSADQAGNTQTRPLAIISIAWNGDIGTFSPELLGTSHPRYGRFQFGNVITHSLTDVLADQRLRAIAAEIARGVGRCRGACPYFAFCRGGAPSNKLGETGRFDTTVTSFCTLTQMVITEIVLKGLENDLDGLCRKPVPSDKPRISRREKNRSHPRA